jgi:hypothetical protein
MFTLFFAYYFQPGPALKFTGDIPVIIQLVICSQKLAIALQYITPVIIQLVICSHLPLALEFREKYLLQMKNAYYP